MGNRLKTEDLHHIVLDLKQMKEFIEHPFVIDKADGVWYWDIDGRRILDGISGIYVATIGHNNRRVIEAIKQQYDKVAFSPPMHGTNMPAIELCKLVSTITPEDLNTVKLLSGGSEATEAAMKLARQYHKQTGNPNKYKVIARYEGFHGTTMGALSATGLKRRKAIFEPALQGYIHVMPPKCYRCPYGLEYPECNVFCARIIGEVIGYEDPDTVSAVIVEPIGNTGGIITPPREYLQIVREICAANNVLLIFDEIITGFGRTGNMFAAQTYEVTPDILCMGKGISSGYAPLSAIAYRDSVAQAFWGEEQEGIEFAHGHTYGGNPISSTAGIASISEIIDRDLCARSRTMGRLLREKLQKVTELGIVGEIRGKGLLTAIELVRDPLKKEPFGQGIEFGVKVGKKALEKGLLLRFDPHWIAIAPPLIVTEEQLEMIVDILTQSLKEVLSELKSA